MRPLGRRRLHDNDDAQLLAQGFNMTHTHRRFPVTDVEAGITAGFVNFNLPQDFLSARVPGSESKVRNFYEAMDETARQVCISAFTASRGNCTVAAHLMGLHRNSVYRLIRRHGLNHLLEAATRPASTTT